MIKVTVKESTVSKDNGHESKVVVKEHKDGNTASVHNGVLTIFSKNAVGRDDLTASIAGYEAGSWIGWEKA